MADVFFYKKSSGTLYMSVVYDVHNQPSGILCIYKDSQVLWKHIMSLALFMYKRNMFQWTCILVPNSHTDMYNGLP